MLERRDNYKLQLISEEAAEWFVRFKDGPRGTADQRKYLRWLRGSPQNAGEALRIGQLYSVLQHADLKYVEVPARAASNVIELSSAAPEISPAEKTQSRMATKGWRIAAVLAVLAVSSVLSLFLKAAWLDHTIQTAASEWQKHALSDGSVIDVGPNTVLRIDFGDERRFIHLAHGDALFQVAKDPARPFVVSTSLATVRAVGTQFGVTRLDGRVVVTVREGVVAVSQRNLKTIHGSSMLPNAGDDPDTLKLTAGEQVTLSGSWPVTPQQVDVERELAWAMRRLIFDNATVADAVGEFNRRNRMQIQLADATIGERSVDGNFDAADPESFANFLLVAEGLMMLRDMPREVLRLESTRPATRPEPTPP